MNFLLLLCLAPGLAGPATPTTTARSLAAANAEAVRTTLIDRSLTATPIELVRLQVGAGGIDAGARAQLIYLDAHRTRVTIDAGPDFPLALAPDGWIVTEPAEAAMRTAAAPAAPSSWIELTDGQRLTGALSPAADTDGAGAGGDGQSIRWSHPRLGVQVIPIERIRRLWQGPPELRHSAERSVATAASETDSLLLRNGDRVSGYIESLGASVVIAPEPAAGAAKPEPFSVPVEQVAYFELSNPPTPRAGVLLYLADGSVVATERLDADAAAGRLTLGAPGAADRAVDAPPLPAAAAGSLDFSDLRTVAMASSRLAALSTLPLVSHGPTGDRRLAEPPLIAPVTPGLPSPLDADDILLNGPMHAEWALPPGATRLAGWITLEPGALAWGDCVVTLSLGAPDDAGDGRVLAQQRLNAAKPVMAVNVDLAAAAAPDARLRVAVEAGENGPVQDRVRLRRMLLALPPRAADGR